VVVWPVALIVEWDAEIINEVAVENTAHQSTMRAVCWEGSIKVVMKPGAATPHRTDSSSRQS
jgi:hypothetical protein